MLALSTASDTQLDTVIARLGEPRYRATQLRQAVWHPHVRSLADVRQLPAALRARLGAELTFAAAEVAEVAVSDQGRTLKLLCRLGDGQTVETVAMETPANKQHARRGTVCVSTQVGCAVGCPFCATGQLGLLRSCSAAEVADQVRLAAQTLAGHGYGEVTHVVYMGMGEPLAAYRSTVDSLRVLVERAGISPRRITVSTSGVAPAIRRLAAEGLPVTLAVSLHAGRDELRDRLVPLNRTHRLAEVMSAAEEFVAQTGRRLTLEWCLIGGVNDTVEDARELRSLAHGARAHVNIIPMNPVPGSPWGPPSQAATRRFREQLAGVRVTLRDTRGGDVTGACGQLRAGLARRRSLRPDGTLGPPRKRQPSDQTGGAGAMVG